ncbi:MAG: hypothetical protein DRG78_03675 [Epsilonproteobacteria bacterium]|nr:MAG: hypothetical protein DRG78_03675 [Campylobacterota bacterium]
MIGTELSSLNTILYFEEVFSDSVGKYKLATFTLTKDRRQTIMPYQNKKEVIVSYIISIYRRKDIESRGTTDASFEASNIIVWSPKMNDSDFDTKMVKQTIQLVNEYKNETKLQMV